MIDPAAARAAEREYAGRLLHREGIPMVLALLDETGTAVPSTDPVALRDGGGYACLLDSYRRALRPAAADSDAGALHDVLAVAAWVHRPGGQPLPDPVPTGAVPAAGLGFAGQRAALAAGRFLRVVNYHNTPEGSADQLAAELRAYLDRYDPVTPADLDAYLDTGVWPLSRPGFVAAFYDGYRNNATVAAPVCRDLGLRAWFLPPTGFLSTPPDRQREFAAAHDVDLLEEEFAQDRLAMTWDDLAGIAERHVVVAHTATHANLAEVTADPRGELELPRDRLAGVTGAAPAVLALREGAPYGPGWRHVEDAGYRFVVSNTAIQRIRRP